jgi:hypothetical protein
MTVNNTIHPHQEHKKTGRHPQKKIDPINKHKMMQALLLDMESPDLSSDDEVRGRSWPRIRQNKNGFRIGSVSVTAVVSELVEFVTLVEMARECGGEEGVFAEVLEEGVVDDVEGC